ncbi:MAG: prolipoprotein diacylglyceryl transferase [Lachnospiraceae bacterium]|jgi:phosphatidylglycerol:prolipoprotein diacylglycerol transferase|nr:prolipoprotein diacylglyceryl transferase [Lachnospiraceae bacterium]
MPDIMGKMDIAFPNLGIYLKNVPKTITIGSFSIAWYGVIIAIGMLAGIFMAVYAAKKSGQNPDTYWDVAVWLLIFSVIGARIYYVIFFWDAYKDDLLQIFNLRGGGLAITGGIIAGVITMVVFARIRKKNFLELLDTVVYGLLIGQIIGRWANFMNREVFGRYTDSLFAMRIPLEMVRGRDIDSTISEHIVSGTNYIQVHPTFLYESLWNLMLLIILLVILRKKRFHGETFLIYMGGYGIGRACIEYIRTDQLYIAGTKIPVNLVVGAAAFVVCVVIGIWAQIMVRKGKIQLIDYSKVEPFDTTKSGSMEK